MVKINQIAIIGAGNLGREIAWLIKRINTYAEEKTWELIGFYDNDKEKQGKFIYHLPVLGDIERLKKRQDDIYVVCAIAESKARAQIIKSLDQCTNIHYATIIDPSAILSDSCLVGEGSILCANTVATIDISVGCHVIVDMGTTIGHDVVIGDFCTLYPGVKISGNVAIGEKVEFGVGSQIIQKLSVGENTIVGAGATVVRSLPGNCTAMGIPAKPVKFH